jgi:hypothetical protein
MSLVHRQMSVFIGGKTTFNLSINYRCNIGNFKDLRTFDHELYVYNTEMRIYGHMSVKLVFITEATGKQFQFLRKNL